MPHRLGAIATRVVVLAWVLVVALSVGVVVLLLWPSGASTAVPTVRSLGMPVPRAALDRTLTIGASPGVTDVGGSRLEIESRYGQFRGHWWWNRGWVYVSGSVLPGTRIHVRIDARSLTVSELPGVRAVMQIGHYGRYGFLDIIQVDVVRFGIGATLLSNPTTGGQFVGRRVLDEIEGRAWTERGLTITRDHVTSTPTHAVPCAAVAQLANKWDLGCRLFGQRPLVSDQRGRFTAISRSIPDAKAVSLTATPGAQTRLPIDSLRVDW